MDAVNTAQCRYKKLAALSWEASRVDVLTKFIRFAGKFPPAAEGLDAGSKTHAHSAKPGMSHGLSRFTFIGRGVP